MLPIRADRAEPEIDHRREKPGEADNELDRAICFRIKPLREISEGKEAKELARNLTADKKAQVTEELGAPTGRYCTLLTKHA